MLTRDIIRRAYHELELVALERMVYYLLQGKDSPNYRDIQRRNAMLWSAEINRSLSRLSRIRTVTLTNSLVQVFSQAVDSVTTEPVNREELRTLISEAEANQLHAEMTVAADLANRYQDVAQQVMQHVADNSVDVQTAAASVMPSTAHAGIFAVGTASGYFVHALSNYLESSLAVAQRDVQHAGIRAAMEVMEEDVIMVSINGEACPKCSPWEGKFISMGGRTPGYPTYMEARAAGLFHVNCFHKVEFIPPDADGVYRVPESYDRQAARERYELEKEQRQLQRAIAECERRDAAAINNLQRQAARMSKDGYQARLDRYDTYREAGIVPEIGKAKDKAEALRMFDELGLWNSDDDRDFAEQTLTTEQLNTIARTITEHQKHWREGERLDYFGVQPSFWPPMDMRGGIDNNNAVLIFSRSRFGGSDTTLLFGSDVDQRFTREGLAQRIANMEANGRTDTEPYRAAVRTLDAIDHGRRDVPDLFVAYTYENPTEGVVAHELGHAHYFHNQERFDEVIKHHAEEIIHEVGPVRDLTNDDQVLITAPYTLRDAPSLRAMDDYHEYVAEAYSWYSQGHTDHIDPEVLEVLRETTDYGY